MATYYNDRELNLLDINYRLFRRYSRLFVEGEISRETLEKKKRELLDDMLWREEYKIANGQKKKDYVLGAYCCLITIYQDYGTLTDAEFKHYSRILQQVMNG